MANNPNQNSPNCSSLFFVSKKSILPVSRKPAHTVTPQIIGMNCEFEIPITRIKTCVTLNNPIIIAPMVLPACGPSINSSNFQSFEEFEAYMNKIVAGDITFDADGGDIKFKDDGTQFGQIANSSSDLKIISNIQDKDIIFRGNDGGTFLDALTLDMSDAGTASFNHDIKLVDNGVARFGTGNDLQIFHNATDSIIFNQTGMTLKVS